jgi:hypothetical protein
MSNQIEIDDDVFALLKAQAEPFVDTPNSVLRRLLGIAPKVGTASTTATQVTTRVTTPSSKHAMASRKTRANSKAKGGRSAVKRTRAAKGTILPEDRYEGPLLRALVDSGGKAPYREIVDAVGRELKDDLLPADFETLNSGAIRWQSRLQFVRLRLIERGYLDRDTPRGTWGITDAGRAALNGAAQ